MENNKITLFRSLNAHSTNYTVKAKIISMWNKKMNGSDSQIYRVDMLLMDEESCSQVISSAEDEFLNAEDFVLTAYIASISVSDMSDSNVQCLSDSVGNVKCCSKDVVVDLSPEKVGIERVEREVDCWVVEPWRGTAERARAA
ncbi:hypothetical protein Hanom_Chr04g00371101 [Helianthus anomalus]